MLVIEGGGAFDHNPCLMLVEMIGSVPNYHSDQLSGPQYGQRTSASIGRPSLDWWTRHEELIFVGAGRSHQSLTVVVQKSPLGKS
jgi:hypothetical protein